MLCLGIYMYHHWRLRFVTSSVHWCSVCAVCGLFWKFHGFAYESHIFFTLMLQIQLLQNCIKNPPSENMHGKMHYRSAKKHFQQHSLHNTDTTRLLEWRGQAEVHCAFMSNCWGQLLEMMNWCCMVLHLKNSFTASLKMDKYEINILIWSRLTLMMEK